MKQRFKVEYEVEVEMYPNMDRQYIENVITDSMCDSEDLVGMQVTSFTMIKVEEIK